MLSKSRRAKYYTRNSKIPQRYKRCKFNSKGILVNSEGEPILANPRSVGTPKMKKISGQEFYKGNIHPQTRAKIVKEMKESFQPYFKNVGRLPDDMVPTHIILEIHEPTGAENGDLDNMSWIYMKVLQDVLVASDILPDDNKSYINQIEVRYFKASSEQERKIVVHLTKSSIAA